MTELAFPRAVLRALTVAVVPSLDRPDEMMELSAGEFVAYAARVSNPANQLNSATYDRLVRYLQKAKHWSPFEMSNAVIEVTTTRDIAHQLLRHTGLRFQEFSQRYSEVTAFHVDHVARRQDEKNRQNSIDDMSAEDIEWFKFAQWEVARFAEERYKEALRRGIAKECSRKLLPEGLTETTLYVNGYLRSWIHYLAQRTDPSTQKEHRDLALAIEAQLKVACPQVFDLETEHVEEAANV